jgi:ribose 1,5-bisphosphokinase
MSAIPCAERLIVVVGPSGAGKDSVLHAWRHRLAGHRVHFAQRVITRAHDASERHEPTTLPEFTRLQAAGELAVCWRANGLHYGVRWRELAPLQHGSWVVMNGSRAHLPTLREQAPALLAVEVTAPEELRAARLSHRGRESDDSVVRRLQRHVPADVALTLHNDGDLNDAVVRLHAWFVARM